jgi:CcmD family protein
MKRATNILRALFAAACVLALASPGTALAQEFQRVEGAARQEVPAGQFVGLAYGFIWVAVLVYVFFVARGLARTDKEIAELRRKVDEATRR